MAARKTRPDDPADAGEAQEPVVDEPTGDAVQVDSSAASPAEVQTIRNTPPGSEMLAEFKAWVRAELSLLAAGHSEETRAQLNP